MATAGPAPPQTALNASTSWPKQESVIAKFNDGTLTDDFCQAHTIAKGCALQSALAVDQDEAVCRLATENVDTQIKLGELLPDRQREIPHFQKLYTLRLPAPLSSVIF